MFVRSYEQSCGCVEDENFGDELHFLVSHQGHSGHVLLHVHLHKFVQF